MEKLKSIIIAFVVLFGIQGFSQETNTDVNPTGDLLKFDIGVLNKLRVVYERPSTGSFTYGSGINFYYGSFPGVKIEPFARLYLGGDAPEGVYFQGRLLAGRFKSNLLFYGNDDLGLTFDVIEREISFTSVGVGIDIGFQWLSGKRDQIPVDISLGVQLMNSPNTTITEEGVDYTSGNIGFNTTGPGGIFNPHITIGKRF